MAETEKNLNIIQINVNSLISLSKRYNLYNFVNTYNPDIVLLNETKLNVRHKVTFKDYCLIRKDRKDAKRGGGTAILIKNGIKFNNYTNNTINKFKYLETCIIKIPLIANKLLFVISSYYPSGNNNSLFKTELLQLFHSLNLDNPNNYYIVAGDLNSKHIDWSNSSNNTKGNMLKEWLSCNEILFRCSLFASTTPSYPRCESYLDVCIADSRLAIEKENNTLNCLKTLDYDSDHKAIQIHILHGEDDHPLTFFNQIPDPKYNYKKTNWKKFKNNIKTELNSSETIPNNRNLTNSEIDFYLSRLNKFIMNSIEKTVPKFKKKNSVEKFVNATIKKLQYEKSKILTIIKKHNRLEIFLTSTELNLHKNNLKLIKKLINDNFVLAVNKHFKEKLESIDHKNASNMFTEVKKQFKTIQPLNINHLKIPIEDEILLRNIEIMPHELEVENTNFVVRDQNQILNTIGSFLESVHSHKEMDPDNDLHTDITNLFSSFLETKNEFETNQTCLTIFNANKKANELNETLADQYFITKDSIFYIFNNLRQKLSSGIDKIPNIILRNIPEAIVLEYCTLFNNMLNNSYFPHAWKLAKVVVLPKKDKDTSNPKNLRAISLLPNISKVYEICINKNILKFCENKNLINDNQFGFKYKHSTIHAIHCLVSNINWNLNKSLCTGACLIDFEKAFDSIWIPGLIYKLLKHKAPMHLIILIHNMISNKSFQVCNNNQMSTKQFIIANGLQQGTVNSPILFNFFIHELLNKIDNIIGFADDIIIYHSDNKIENINKNLQNYFNIVQKYALDWQMKINFKKCETILFRPPVGKCNYNVKKNWKKFGIVSNNNIHIPNKDVVKYLGIYLDKFLYFNNHTNLQIIKARNAFFLYKKLFYSKYIKHKVKVLLYKSLIRPILTYGCQIWFNISPSYMEKIRIFERKCLRACTSLYRSANSNYKKFVSNKMLYNVSKISRIDNFIIHLIRNHIIKCFECKENNLIIAPYYANEEYIYKTLRNGYIAPEAFLYLDRKGYIQNESGIPIFYHIYRRANIKSIDCNQMTTENRRFDTNVYTGDKNMIPNMNNTKFWWLTE